MEKLSPMCWARVDDRLIHGQVMVGWRRYLGFTAVLVLDDQAAGDPFLADVLRLAAPSDVPVFVYPIENSLSALTQIDTSRLVILFKTPQSALDAIRCGVSLSHLNIGNLAAAPGRRRVHQSIFIGPDEAAALDELARQGVRITFQATPDDAAVDWSALAGSR